MFCRTIAVAALFVLPVPFWCVASGEDLRASSTATALVEMPDRGICAHRGASTTHPENTLSALAEAVRLGVQMIEFDVARSRDDRLVLMHDATIDRTTDGTGRVAEFTLAELKRLDAGSWKAPEFRGERVPTLDEALAVMPSNVWLNVHLKGDARLAQQTTRQIVAQRRLPQAFLACGQEAARAARQIDPRIQICNMDRQADVAQYVAETIENGSEFIQLLGPASIRETLIRKLALQGVRINYCCTNDAEMLRQLFEAGVQFPLVDDVGRMVAVANELGIPPSRPGFCTE